MKLESLRAVFSAFSAAGVRFPLEPGLEVTVVSLERLIRLKREAGRPKDLLDLEALDRGVVEEPR